MERGERYSDANSESYLGMLENPYDYGSQSYVPVTSPSGLQGAQFPWYFQPGPNVSHKTTEVLWLTFFNQESTFLTSKLCFGSLVQQLPTAAHMEAENYSSATHVISASSYVTSACSSVTQSSLNITLPLRASLLAWTTRTEQTKRKKKI